MPPAPRPRVAIRVVRADGGPEALIPMRGDVLLAGRQGDLSLPDDPFVADTQVYPEPTAEQKAAASLTDLSSRRRR